MADTFKNLWVKDQEDNFAVRWVKYYQPPARPVPQEIDFLRDFIGKLQKERDNLDILIMGSTTEYRDLMFELGIKPTVVDLSANNYEILSQKLQHPEGYKEREKLLEQKWQEMHDDKKYDLVLAHYALTVNPLDSWDGILNRVSDLLKPNGLFITNNWVATNAKPTIDEITKDYDEKWKGKYSLFCSMMPKIYYAVRDDENGEIKFQEICKLIEDGYAQGKITPEDYQEFKNLAYENFNMSMYISTEEQFKQYVEKYFTIEDKIILEPYPNADLMPEWILRKK